MMIRHTHRTAILTAVSVILAATLLVNCGSSHRVTDTDPAGATTDTDTIKQLAAIPLANALALTSWDISWVDSKNRKYYLADRTNFSLDVLDLSATLQAGIPVTAISPPAPNKFQGLVSDPNVGGPNEVSGPNGVVIVNSTEAWVTDAPSFSGPIVASASLSVAYATDNCDSSVKVINLASKSVTDNIKINGCFRSDEVAFDPTDQFWSLRTLPNKTSGKRGTP